MGAVYAAVDENLGLPVAVKENLFTTEEYARQFRREATILAGLRHPNLPRVTDHFVIPGQGQYLVMDYIDGEDLRQRLEPGEPIPEDEVVGWARQICEAIGYLHHQRRPILHRDIKPSNIRLTSDGRAVLVDFGLARVEGATATTGAKGMSPGFAPPEQYGNSRVDVRADIYSFAATLYALLTGVPPEDALDRAMGWAQLTPILTRRHSVSSGLAKVVEKGLEIQADARYASIDDFCSALAGAVTKPVPVLGGETRVAGGLPTAPRPPVMAAPWAKPAQRSWGLWIGLGVAGVAVILGGVLLSTRRVFPSAGGAASAAPGGLGETTAALSAPPPTAPRVAFGLVATSSPPPAATVGSAPSQTELRLPATLMPSDTPEAQPSPVGGGDLIAFVSDQTGTPQIFLLNPAQSLATMVAKQITDLSEGACQPDWSPDGTRLAFTSPCPGIQSSYPNAAIFVMNWDGTNASPISTAPGGDYDPAWSPDGKQIAFTSLEGGQPQVFVMDADGQNRKQLSPLGAVDSQPRWSPDGGQIVFVSSSGGQTPTVFVMDADGTNRQQYSRGPGAYSSPDWSPNGQLMLAVRAALDGQVVTSLFANHGFNEKQVVFASGAVTSARFSPDSRWVVADAIGPGGNRNLYIGLVVGGLLQPLTLDSHVEFDPAWRPVIH
jgi:Tol biopolymer transport system component